MDKFNGKTIYKSFYEILKYSNYKVLKCFKLIWNINSITKNKGSIIVLTFFLIYLIFLIIYIFKGISPLKEEAKKQLIKKTKNIGNNNNTIQIYNKNKNNITENNKEKKYNKNEKTHKKRSIHNKHKHHSKTNKVKFN